MRKSARAERARQIEETAYALLDQHGLEGLSIQALAKAARASNETLYRWYGDKTGLFKALVVRNAEEVRTLLEQGLEGNVFEVRLCCPLTQQRKADEID